MTYHPYFTYKVSLVLFLSFLFAITLLFLHLYLSGVEVVGINSNILPKFVVIVICELLSNFVIRKDRGFEKLFLGV